MNSISSEVVNIPCPGCGEKDVQIEDLAYKLKYAVNQQELLSDECEKLKKALQEAEWKLGTRGLPPPRLPNEIWHSIFSFATYFDGLAYSSLREYDQGQAWKQSLHTRRSIPLVCKQWLNVGMGFLYNHLVLSESLQIIKLQKTFKVHPEYANHVRGVELVLSAKPSEPERRIRFYNSSVRLIASTHRIQILSFKPQSFDPGLGTGDFERVLEVAPGNFTTLQLDGNHYGGCVWNDVELDMPKLDTISFGSSSRFVPAGSSRFSCFSRGTLQVSLATLHTLYLPYWLDPVGLPYKFQQALNNVTTVHLSLLHGFDPVPSFSALLNATPRLENLSLYHYSRYQCWKDQEEEEEELKEHGYLRLISIHLDYPENIESLAYDLHQIFIKLEYSGIPACSSIQVHGGFPDGCLDGGYSMEVMYKGFWRDAIRICEEKGVQLLNHIGSDLRFWSDIHGFCFYREENGELISSLPYMDQDRHTVDGTTDTSDDENWTQDSGKRMFSSDWDSTDEEEVVSTDSPYIYESRPDIRMLDDKDISYERSRRYLDVEFSDEAETDTDSEISAHSDR